MRVKVIGGGLAGCEAAWQIANAGIDVALYEMKPQKYSPAHHLPYLAELVCSNSLKADNLENACGLLKEEMRRLGSLIIPCADENRVPAGGALAVDREGFSKMITEKIKAHPNVTVDNTEVTEISDDEYTIIATGPLTSEPMAEFIKSYIDAGDLYFYDAAAPIVTFDSINMDIAYFAARYEKGGADYINCPMNKEQYENFYNALITAETAELKEFDKSSLKVFEGCMPIEIMAKRGKDTLSFGPLKPVGLPDPKTGRDPYAVVQLRRDNSEGSLYNIVGFQTHLKFGEQKRVFSMIPGLENAEFVRYGVMHRNTFINSPKLLGENYRVKNKDRLYFAGQITGVEGYVESAASGLLAGLDMARVISGKESIIFPRETAIGALAAYVSNPGTTDFQPMNANFGVIASINERYRKKRERYAAISARSLKIIDEILKNFNIQG